MSNPEYSKIIIDALFSAGEAITAIENGSFTIKRKSDQSPVTDADLISDKIVREALQRVSPELPLISEEVEEVEERKCTRFWLLDPLDGTKEFISGNGEYCIALALIDKGRPVEAYIYSPVSKHLWTASKGSGAYCYYNGEKQRLPLLLKNQDKPYTALRSRSHHIEEEELWYNTASSNNLMEYSHQGSAIKFCKIAEGMADFYIKKGKILGWDIAAGDLILSESGGGIISYPGGENIKYSPNSDRMPQFLAYGKRIENPEEWLF